VSQIAESEVDQHRTALLTHFACQFADGSQESSKIHKVDVVLIFMRHDFCKLELSFIYIFWEKSKDFDRENAKWIHFRGKNGSKIGNFSQNLKKRRIF